VLAGWRAEMARLRAAAADERRAAEARWLSASASTAEARAWHDGAVRGTRWYWEEEEEGADGAGAAAKGGGADDKSFH